MAKLKLVIGNKNYSSWSLRAWLLLTTFGIEFEEIRVPLSQADSRTRLGEFSPTYKVPVLVDGPITVWDSLAICEYISENYLQDRGWPASVAARAECRSVCAEMHSGFPAMRNELPMNCRASRKIELSGACSMDIDRIIEMWTSLRSRYHQEGEWLFGNFSIADCMFAPVVLRIRTYGIALSGSAEMYYQCVLKQEYIRNWISAGSLETEVIAEDEAGTSI